jgi:hypothetical protein
MITFIAVTVLNHVSLQAGVSDQGVLAYVPTFAQLATVSDQ